MSRFAEAHRRVAPTAALAPPVPPRAPAAGGSALPTLAPPTEVPPSVRVAGLVAALAVLVVAAALGIAGRSVWIDEMYAMDTATRPLREAYRRALDFEMQPPLYFLALHFWLRLGESVEFARVLSAGFLVLSIGVFAMWAHRARLGWAGVMLPMLAALHPYVLWAAAEARGYALTFLLLAASTALWLRILERADADRRLLVAYAVVSCLALLNFYYAGFLLLGHALGAIVHRRNAARVIGALAVTGALMLPWVPTILAQVAAHPNGNEVLPAVNAAWLLGFFFQAVLPVALVGRTPVAVLLVVAFAAAVIASVLLARRDDRLPAAALAAFATAMLVFLLLRIANLFEVQPRYLGVVVPPLLFWIALVVHRAGRGARAGVAAAGVVGVFGLAAASHVRNHAPVQDWRAAVEVVHRHEAAGQPIFLFEAASVLPFRHYYRGGNAVHGLPRDPALRRYGPEEDRIASAEELERVLPATGDYWLLVNHLVQGDVGLPLLRAHLRDRATIVRRDSVRSVHVYQLRARPVTAMRGAP